MNSKKNKKIKYVWMGIALLLIAIPSYFIFKEKDTGVTQIVVGKKDIVQSVLASGKTKAIDSVNLGFEKSGKVTNAYVDVGSRVVAGQVLVNLDNSDLQADLSKAKASLSEEFATNITNSVAISDAAENAKAVVAYAYTNADNVIRQNVDQFFTNPNEKTTSFTPSLQNNDDSLYYFSIYYKDKISINDKRKDLIKEFVVWKSEVDNLNNFDIDDLLFKSEEHVISVKKLVDEVSGIIFGLSAPQSNFIPTVNGYKTDMSNARNTINTTLTNIVSAKEKLNNARAVESKSLSDLNNTSIKDARVLQIQATIQNIESQITKTQLVAPFSGVVTKQSVSKGEIVGAGTSIVSIISDDRLEIESNISEVNIGKILVGNKVSITLDAYPGKIFYGLVSYIDPGETIVDGVVNYKIKISLSDGSDGIKSGLTANLNIETAKKSDVASVPLFAVTKKGDSNFVKKIIGEGLSQETEVVLGVIAQDGFVEIVSGLSEGDTIEVGSKQ
jgi:RND family efflux transporter MFP subunit